MKRAFVDTSAWYAFARKDDPDHKTIKAGMDKWEGRLVTSNFIFDELITLVLVRAGFNYAKDIGETLLSPSVVEMTRVLPEDEERAWQFFCRSRDKGYSFTDCVSFSLMRRLGIETAIATDRHFKQAGFFTESDER